MNHSKLPLPGVSDRRVLRAMRRVRRELFVPEQYRDRAYGDHPLPIDCGQTISQPLIVAEMTAAVCPQPWHRVLDVGTGSGYQAAVLAELASQVYSIEIVEPLAIQARERLARLGYGNVEVRCGDGSLGWPERAPFDAVVCAAAPAEVPHALIDQLAPGGRLVIPVGIDRQQLKLICKDQSGRTTQRTLAAVAFVPMTGAGQAQENSSSQRGDH